MNVKKYKFLEKYPELNEDIEMERIFQDIEQQQMKNMSLIQDKNDEIEHLNDEISRLKRVEQNYKKEIHFLRKKVDELKSLLISNEEKFSKELDEKVAEFYRIIEIYRKIDDQNRIIEELERLNLKQKHQFEIFEKTGQLSLDEDE